MEAVADLLNPAQIQWVLEGGAARLLQGIERSTADVDVLVAKKDITQVQLLFDHYTVRPFEYNVSSDGVFAGYYGVYRFGEIQVETMAELRIRRGDLSYEVSVDAEMLQRAQSYTLEGRAIPLTPYETALLAYLVLGRGQVVRAIIHHLKRSGRSSSFDWAYVRREAEENRLPEDLIVRLSSAFPSVRRRLFV